MSLVSILFLSFAAICAAIMDVVNFHYHSSVFRNMNPSFWNQDISWRNKKFLGWMTLDAWHIAKLGMIFNVSVAIADKWYHVPLYMIIWGIWFELFYSKILRK